MLYSPRYAVNAPFHQVLVDFEMMRGGEVFRGLIRQEFGCIKYGPLLSNDSFNGSLL